ncbi:hypothetical protein GF339_15120 [candidate division KSB3 bacterium]|uniref:Cyclophilin TM1367-like domain-containing protein n=1 Tax=candidate division KSB3 bacterium TaxID=2044937 RepID=A0A9D5JY94_9BACT|nr:hypothetical protein [candidate division KSB3 bacterium]MBD3325916.1 hypothetical protein [candidate division KSB3 bacterium]
MKNITIAVETITLAAQLNDSETAQKVWEALPIEGSANTWGDEIYFSIPVALDQAPDAQAEVEIGTLGYWEPGQAFCIFYGQTPASTGEKPRAASPVNIFGRVLDDATQLRGVRSGARVKVTQAD